LTSRLIPGDKLRIHTSSIIKPPSLKALIF
jgi:hypothetical protein